MSKLPLFAFLLLTACGDPGGAYSDFTCTARDNKSGQCTAATYSCDRMAVNMGLPMLTYHRYDAPRCM